MNLPNLDRCLKKWCLGAGQILLNHRGKIVHPRRKESPSSVVCDADFASEKYLVKSIRDTFPEHNILSEEAGHLWRGSEYTWVLDPLDGTSNFVAGLPWFGVQIGLVKGGQVLAAAMYLPVEDALYTAELGQGTLRNGKPVRVTKETDARNVLCSFAFDPSSPAKSRVGANLLFQVSRNVRNTRATNSLVDFCYTVDGRLGGCINLKTMVWDIVPIALIMPEAGGEFSDVRGKEIVFEFGADVMKREYAIVGGSGAIYDRLVKLTKAA